MFFRDHYCMISPIYLYAFKTKNLERNRRPYEVESIFIKISRAPIVARMSTTFKCVQLAFLIAALSMALFALQICQASLELSLIIGYIITPNDYIIREMKIRRRS